MQREIRIGTKNGLRNEANEKMPFVETDTLPSSAAGCLHKSPPAPFPSTEP